jgi:hypothetical protein
MEHNRNIASRVNPCNGSARAVCHKRARRSGPGIEACGGDVRKALKALIAPHDDLEMECGLNNKARRAAGPQNRDSLQNDST